MITYRELPGLEPTTVDGWIGSRREVFATARDRAPNPAA
jgi:hypothetical protein